ncbi:4'-phosphopantetheinyl transferase superfamily protein [Streptomyces sp. NPDC048664]|uniref:4'-phosphopantetheinyl transferase family protein n=1 Tax=Streptomyces sp. NPDC048664 TaxID=3154505 RepID=UPI003431D2F2
MFEELLPASVAVVEAYEGDAIADGTVLYPQEEAVVARAVDKRRREFVTVRACARRAMARLGVPEQPVVPGERGAPGWPKGVIGSMTHCDGYGAAALARAGELASLGIDAEPHEPLPEGVADVITLPAERERLRGLARSHPSVHWDRLLFSAKESVYKAWYPLTERWLDFLEADVDIDPGDGSGGVGGFRARLLVAGPVVAGRRIEAFDGRWTTGRGLVATSVVVPGA